MPLDPREHPFVSEFHVVARSVEVRMQGRPTRIRIDALEHLGAGVFSTQAYRRERVVLTPASATPLRGPTQGAAWVDHHLPWTQRRSADDALTQALSLLRMDCDP